MKTSDQHHVAHGFAAWVAGGTIATWDNAGAGPAYTAATVYPIFIGPDMPPTPDRVIVLTPTAVAQRMARIDQGLQVRVRGVAYADPADVQDMAQAIHDLAYPNGFPAVGVDFGTIGRVGVLTGARGPIVRDDDGRYGWVSNYVVRWRKVAPIV